MLHGFLAEVSSCPKHRKELYLAGQAVVSGGDRHRIPGRVGEPVLLGCGTWRREYHTVIALQNLHGTQLNSGYIECQWSEGLQGCPGAADARVGSWEELM